MRVNVSMADVIRFVREKAPKGVGLWPDDTLARFLTQREDRRELAIVQRQGQVVAIACVTADAGDIHIWCVIGKGYLGHLVRQLWLAFPEWRDRNITADRRGKRVRITPEYLNRIAA